jgi:SAM-dependent methyltransferase
MKIVTLDDLREQVLKICEVKNPKIVNKDMLWKYSVILKSLEENNLVPKKVLDVGAGCANLPLYLLVKHNIEYWGVEWGEKASEEFANCVLLNNHPIDKVNYLLQDFLKFETKEKFDLVLDICSITHFKPTKEFCANDGVYESAKTIYSVLEDNGYFLCASDCIDEDRPNHRGELNKEYISIQQMIDCYTKAGLKLVGVPMYLSATEINSYNIHNIGLDSIQKSFSWFDPGHRDHYDRVFLAFTK